MIPMIVIGLFRHQQIHVCEIMCLFIPITLEPNHIY